MATKTKVIVTKTTIVGKKLLGGRISNSLGKKSSLNCSQIELVISQLLEEVKKALMNAEEIRFPGYLSLKTAVSKARIGMNLQTKKKMSIPAKRVPKARFSSNLKAEIGKKK